MVDGLVDTPKDTSCDGYLTLGLQGDCWGASPTTAWGRFPQTGIIISSRMPLWINNLWN